MNQKEQEPEEVPVDIVVKSGYYTLKTDTDVKVYVPKTTVKHYQTGQVFVFFRGTDEKTASDYNVLLPEQFVELFQPS